jgi:hypothetical protein
MAIKTWNIKLTCNDLTKTVGLKMKKEEASYCQSILSKTNDIRKYTKEIRGVLNVSENSSVYFMPFSPPVNLPNEELFNQEYTDFLNSLESVYTLETIKPVLSWSRVIFDTYLLIKDLRITQDEQTKKNQEIEENRKIKEQEQTKKNQENEVERVALLKDYPYLETLANTTKSRWALCAHNIRLILSKNFPGQAFKVNSESYSGGDSVNVSWTDGPTVSQVRAYTSLFSGGSFNGMIDMYEDNHSGFTSLNGYSKYIFTNRTINDQTKKDFAAGMGLYPENMTYEEKNIVSRELQGTSFYKEVVPTAPTQSSDEMSISEPNNIVKRNLHHDGIEIQFPTKPSTEVLSKLRLSSFRWSRRGFWYAKYTEDRYKWAMSLTR